MRAIVLFARSPRREAAAKRLQAPAARLFEAVVSMWIETARRCGATPLIACEESDRAFIAPELAWIAQRSGPFGERVAGASEDAFARGFDSVIVAAIDAPPRDVLAAFESLERGVAVVSPSRDGGINYIGLTQPERRLLETFVPRDRTLFQRCRRYFDALLVVGGAIDIDDASALDAARGDRAWRGLLEPRLVPHRTLVVRVLRGVAHQCASRPPPVSS